MTEQEALDLCNNYTIDINLGMESVFKTTDYLEVCAKALKKQIPKEPTNGLCPTCGSITHTDCGDSFLDYSLDFCPNCGQALKWD